MDLQKYRKTLNNTDTLDICGRVTEVIGLSVECSGPAAKVGDLCELSGNNGKLVRAEVVGFRGDRMLLMPYGVSALTPKPTYWPITSLATDSHNLYML